MPDLRVPSLHHGRDEAHGARDQAPPGVPKLRPQNHDRRAKIWIIRKAKTLHVVSESPFCRPNNATHHIWCVIRGTMKIEGWVLLGRRNIGTKGLVRCWQKITHQTTATSIPTNFGTSGWTTSNTNRAYGHPRREDSKQQDRFDREHRETLSRCLTRDGDVVVMNDDYVER